MSDVAIRVENLGKMYRIEAARERHDTLRDALVHFLRDPLGQAGRNADANTIWALRNVSFEVKRGEVVGVIGRNGAGKSTLLKILSRITEPTEGLADLYGRVGSLLEVGTGFHPELTGRENIYLSGAILGMHKAEIDRRFDEIVAFAEIEKFLETPVKRYSSGMYVRLAFAVAAHLEPEILLVDEVLAVGDAQFQKKCLGKMEDISSHGRTILFVSHNMGAINSLTQNCIYLKGGQLAMLAQTRKVVEAYLQDNLRSHSEANDLGLDLYRRDVGTKSPVRFSGLWINEPSDHLPIAQIGQTLKLYIELEVEKPISGAHISVNVKNDQGEPAVLLVSKDNGFAVNLAPGKHLLRVDIYDLPLTPGIYYADFGINQMDVGTRAYDVILDYPLFEVRNMNQVLYWSERPWGMVHWPKVEWVVAQ